MLILHAVVQLDETIFEALDGAQLQGHVTMTTRYQWNAIPNKHWGHTDDELVDRLRVKKRGDETPSPARAITGSTRNGRGAAATAPF